MTTVTLEGPVVVLPEEEYQHLLSRLDRLEGLVAQWGEDREDLRVMREAEVEYRTGDAASFADLLVEVQAERK